MLDELKAYPQWIVRRKDKIPLRASDGYNASVTNSADWSTFDIAAAACAANPELGLGFVLSADDPFCFIDLDSTDDETIQRFQIEISNAFQSYQEVSPSGKGLHIVCKGSVPQGKRKNKVEVYSSQRYMTVTFQVYKDLPINECQDLITHLFNDMGGAVDTTLPVVESKAPTQSDDEVYSMALNASNGELFDALYKGEWKERYKSQSEADFALIDIIAFYTDSQEQTARLFLASALGQRDKAHRPIKIDKAGNRIDYVGKMVRRSFDRKIELAFDPAIFKPKIPLNISQNETELKQPEELHTVWMQPPGLLGDIAAYIYGNAVNPVPEVAIAATCAYVGGIIGRTYNISRTGLNNYYILLARTAGGKEGASQGMDKLTGALRLVVPTLIDQFIGPSEIASPPALIKQLAETPCMVSHKGEIGFWLQKLCSKYANTNDSSLRGLLLDLFSKSGHGQVVKGSVYSDRAKNVPSINNPALTIFGDSTQEAFYKAIDEDSVAEGLVSRFTVFECEDKRPTYNKANNSFPPSAEIVWKLATLVKRCIEKDQTNEVINIAETEEATAYHMAFRERCTDKAFEDRESPTAQIWTRAHLRLLRLAGLAAVCVNPDSPCVTLTELQWAEQVVMHGIHAMLRRFEAGQVGEKSLYLEQKILMTRVLKTFWRDGYCKKVESGGITAAMYEHKIVSQRYLQIYSMKHACFRNEKNATQAFKNILTEFIEGGLLSKIDMQRVKESGRTGIAYYVNSEIMRMKID
jgi:hypothetical protein